MAQIDISRSYTIGQIAKALRCHEQTVRAYLSEINTAMDDYDHNLLERVAYADVLALWARHQENVTFRRLIPLLQG